MVLGLFRSAKATTETAPAETAAQESRSVASLVPAAAPINPILLSAPAKTPESAEPAAPKACPQCGSTEPWGFASWCPECGYYPKLSQAIDDRADATANSEETQRTAVVVPDTYLGMLKALPAWLQILCGGIMGIFV